MTTTGKSLALIAAALLAAAGMTAHAQDAKKAAPSTAAKAKEAKSAPQRPMGFFVSSVGSGKGADYGGLAGADLHCQNLATVAGAGRRTWHAYLSTTAQGGGKLVNARERIGRGPWYNAKGELIARNVDDLHFDAKISKESALTEKGEAAGRHDILTGSDSFGYAMEGKSDTTCGNWTKSSADGSAQLGHYDRRGTGSTITSRSWNMAHPSRGCSTDNLRSTGGDGLLYCFAAR